MKTRSIREALSGLHGEQLDVIVVGGTIAGTLFHVGDDHIILAQGNAESPRDAYVAIAHITCFWKVR